MKIFLDDVRHPQECLGYMHLRIGKLNPIYLEDWIVVKNYEEFCKVLEENIEKVTHISFDHDLADIHYDPSTWTESFSYKEKTGADCAIFTRELYQKRQIALPTMFVHSMNPVGRERIHQILNQ